MTPDTIEKLPALRTAWLCVNAHKGQAAQRIEVIQNCEKRVRIRALKPTTLGGQRRVIQPGETALVPTWAVQNLPPKNPAASAKRAKRTATVKHYCYTIETTDGLKTRYYSGPTEHAARQKADKVGNVIRVLKSHPVTEAQYIAGRKAVGQD